MAVKKKSHRKTATKAKAPKRAAGAKPLEASYSRKVATMQRQPVRRGKNYVVKVVSHWRRLPGSRR